MKIWQFCVNEDGTAVLLARVCASSGSTTPIVGEGYPIVQANVSTITYSVFDMDNDNAAILSAQSLTVSAVIFDTLQDTAGYVWTADSLGYNFKHTLPITAFPTGGHTYRYEAKFTMSDAGVTWIAANCKANTLFTS